MTPTNRLIELLMVAILLLTAVVLGLTLKLRFDSQPQPQPSEQSKPCLESKMFNPVDFSQPQEQTLD